MPLDETGSKHLKAMLAAAKTNPLPFGLALGKKRPEDTALVLDKKKPADKLLKQARSEPGVDKQKSCSGMLSVEGSKVLLHCADDPPAGVFKRMKAFFKASKLPYTPVVLGPDGAEFEPDEEALVAAGSDARTKAEETEPAREAAAVAVRLQALQARISAAPKTPGTDKLKMAARRVLGDLQGGDVESAESGVARIEHALAKIEAGRAGPEESAPITEQSKDDPARASWLKRKDDMDKRVAAAATAAIADPSKLRAAWAMAVEKADGGLYSDALRIADRVLETIEKGGGDRHDPNAASDEAIARKWKAVKKKVDTIITYALMSSVGDVERVREIYADMMHFDQAGDPATALELLPELSKVLKDMQEQKKKLEKERKAKKKQEAAEVNAELKKVRTEYNALRHRLDEALKADPEVEASVKLQQKTMAKAIKTKDPERARDALWELEAIILDAGA